MIDLSIIILTWNTSKITKKCVDSLLKNIKNIRYEIIVVDNGSTDNTKALFADYKSVKYLNTGSNLGFSKGNNLGAKITSGKYYLFLNSDMEYVSGLDKMLSYLKNNPKIGLIGPQFLNLDLSPQGSIFPSQTAINALKEFWFNQKTFSKYFQTNQSSVHSISGGAVLIRKEIFHKVKGWNEKYFFYYEDMDFCRRVRSLDLEIYYFPDCRFIHRHGTSVNLLPGKNTGYQHLVAGSIKYHGVLIHYLINFIIWSGQKWHKLLSLK